LTIGIDPVQDEKIRGIKSDIAPKKEDMEILRSRLAEFEEEAADIEAKIKENHEAREVAHGGARKAEEKMIQIGKHKDSELLANAKQVLDVLKEKIKKIDRNTKALSDRQAEVRGKSLEISEKIAIRESEIQELHKRISAYIERTNEKGKAAVRVGDVIFEKTTINGPRSSLVLKDNIRSARILEVKDSPTEDGRSSQWYLKVF
jgi:predicted  nucleic acid-binding Zn-ribbon protein